MNRFARISAFGTLMLGMPVLGGCVSPGNAVGAPTAARPAAAIPTSRTPPPTRPAPSRDGFIAPRVMNVPGLEMVIGRNVAGLQQQFGQADLNVKEGDVRKLQYRREACVLDIYLYPLRPGGEPSATHVEARRSSDGLDVDRAACVAAILR